MKPILKLFAISLVGAGLITTACGGDDDDTAAGGTGGTGGTAGKGGKGGKGGSAGMTAGKSGSAGKTGGSKGGSGGTGQAGGSGNAGEANGATAGTEAGSPGTGGSAAGSGGSSGGGEAGASGAGGSAVGFSEPPTLGDQIDRIGRPGVNTALTDPFDIVNGMTENQVKDAYNAASDPAAWSTAFQGYIRINLAILDALDSTGASEGCGNQFAIGAPSTSPLRYDGLAGVLVDDRLYVNTDGGSCGQYLAVEANATGIVVNTDCGGRMPTYDVIDTTYSVLAAGVLSGVTDGVAADGSVSATFPFLGAPQ